MDELKFLKQEEKLCNEMWDQNYEETKNTDTTNLYHMHVCDFELLYFASVKNIKKLDKKVEKECKKYLKSIGKERDENLCCCDHCIHDRYMTISANTETVLNICTLAIDKRLEED